MERISHSMSRFTREARRWVPDARFPMRFFRYLLDRARSRNSALVVGAWLFAGLLALLIGTSAVYVPVFGPALFLIPLGVLCLIFAPKINSVPRKLVLIGLLLFAILWSLTPKYFAVDTLFFLINFQRIGFFCLFFLLIYCFSFCKIDFKNFYTNDILSKLAFFYLIYFGLSSGYGFLTGAHFSVFIYGYLPCLSAFLSVFLIEKPFQTRLMPWLIVLAGVFICGLGLLQRVVGHLIIPDLLPAWIMSSTDYLAEIGSENFRHGRNEFRVKAVSVHPLEMANFIVIVAAISAIVVIFHRNLLLRGLACLVIVMSPATILAGDVRSGVVALGAGLGVALLVPLLRLILHRRPFHEYFLLFLIPGSALLSFIAAFDFLYWRLFPVVTGAKTNPREVMFELMLQKLPASPIFGFGIGHGAVVLNFRASPGGPVTVDTNIVTQLMGGGLVGFFAYYGLTLSAIVISFLTAVKGDRQTAAICGAISAAMTAHIVSGLGHSIQHYAFVPMLLVALLIRYRNENLSGRMSDHSSARKRRSQWPLPGLQA